MASPVAGPLKTEARGLKPEMKFIMALSGSEGPFDRASPAGSSELNAARVVVTVRVPLRLTPRAQRDARARRGTRRCTRLAGEADRLEAATELIGL